MAEAPVSVLLGTGVGVYQPYHEYSKTLAASLSREGMLRRLFRVSPHLDVEVLDPAADGSLSVVKRFHLQKCITRPAWSIWSRMPRPVRDVMPLHWLYKFLADQMLRPWVPRAHIFHGTMNNCLGQLARAKELGAATLVDVGSSHPERWRQVMIETHQRAGTKNPRPVDGTGATSRRMEREFKACDKITVLSSPTRRSFEEHSYGHKAVVVLPGIDHTFFTPPAKPDQSPVFRVCYVGRVEGAKGLEYLLRAWKRLALANAELLLIGQVQPDGEAILREFGSASVNLAGFLPPHELAQRYRESNVLAFPSLVEGFGLVLLEAMACGVPVIASDESGGIDCVTEGKDGFIVPARDSDRLADAILWCYRHRNELQAMGAAARAKVDSQFTLEHYYQRQIALYKSSAAGNS